MADYFNYQKSPLKESPESDTFSQIFSPDNSKTSYAEEYKFDKKLREKDLIKSKTVHHIENKYDLEDKNFINQLKSNNELLFKATKIFNQLSLYPFKALRWQCQIHSESYKYHTTPFTLMPVFYNLNYYGFYTLWKGCFSMAAYSGIKTILESILAELTTWEKNPEDVKKKEKLYGHISLKMISSALTTPILTAVIYESVQSGISNENFGLVDLARETYNRITGYRYNYRTRMISLWSLVIPNSLYFLSFHFFSLGFEKIFLNLINLIKQIFNDKRRISSVDEVEAEVVDEPYTKALSELLSYFGSTLALYPIETILNRLMVQGTRTIIDNTDTGYGVVPINTRYDGFFDCARSIHETEGFLGYYKGFGTLIIEILIGYAVMNFGKTVALRIFDSEWTTKSDMKNMKNLMTNSIN